MAETKLPSSQIDLTTNFDFTGTLTQNGAPISGGVQLDYNYSFVSTYAADLYGFTGIAVSDDNLSINVLISDGTLLWMDMSNLSVYGVSGSGLTNANSIAFFNNLWFAAQGDGTAGAFTASSAYNNYTVMATPVVGPFPFVSFKKLKVVGGRLFVINYDTTAGYNARVCYSIDGTTWTVCNDVPSEGLNDIYYTPADTTIHVVGSAPATNFNLYYTSIDNGTTWVDKSGGMGSNRPLYAIAVNGQNIVIKDSRPYFNYTLNGGATWATTLNNFNGSVKKIVPLAPLTFVAFGDGGGSTNQVLLETHDGGLTWFDSPSTLSLPDPATPTSKWSYEEAYLLTNGKFLLACNYYNTPTNNCLALGEQKIALSELPTATIEYSNATPTPSAIGGIAAGSTFTNQSMDQMWNAILYPYQVPAFTSFNFGQASPIEVGTTLSGAQTFVWTDTHPANIAPSSITITDVTGTTTLVSGGADTGSNVVSIGSVQKVSATTNTWSISATDTKANTLSRNDTIAWEWMRYYGESLTDPLVEADIKALRVSGLAGGFAGTYSFVGGGYKYICYAAALGNATVFKDTSNNLPVAMNTMYTVSITNAQAITTNYNVHRTQYVLGGSINIQVS